MGHQSAILENYAAELAPLAGFQIIIDVGIGRGDMQPWEFDELQSLFIDMYPSAPPLKQRKSMHRS